MIAAPAATPVTIPVAEPTDTIPVYAGALHAPTLAESLKVAAAPAHRVVVPIIADGDVFTVTVMSVVHPVGKV